MIIDKHKKHEEHAPQIDSDHKNDKEVVHTNPMVEAYRAVKNMLLTIREDPNDSNSPPYFKTIKLDNGQLSRNKNSKWNREYAIRYPAVFIHYINVYFNVGQYRISEGKATMRIHYVLNRLNNSDDEFETEGMEMFDRIIKAIESQKNKFPSLVTRFQLQYWDQPETFDHGLQPYWIDYQIWFTDTTAYKYQDYVDAYVISPPFTNHSDQNEVANPENLPNELYPKFEDSVAFQADRKTESKKKENEDKL